MGQVHATQACAGTVVEAERCWYDTARWPNWVDECERVLSVDSTWPRAGAAVTWESGPAGRGRVTERVVVHDPLRGQLVEVTDTSIRGQQRVSFTPSDEGVEVRLELDYQLRNRTIVSPLVDLLFIRRAMTASLQATVRRFGVELQAARERPAPEH
ncbi:MAG: SRPBCC family protein [Actinomycetota bacterium]|nr:SRPBCC family protein [Actinomycetota bacterium]